MSSTLTPHGLILPDTGDFVTELRAAIRENATKLRYAIVEGDARLTNARTPTAHATSHITGSDRILARGTDSGTADGGGYLEDTVTHGLGATPTAVLIQCLGAATAEWTSGVFNITSTQFTVGILTGVAGHAVSYMWVAVR